MIKNEIEKYDINSCGIPYIFRFTDEKYELPAEVRNWSAQWIWGGAEDFEEYQTCPYTLFERKQWNFTVFYFRKKCFFEHLPESAKLYITADGQYNVWINGRFIGRGSAQPGGDYGNCDPLPYKFYEEYDVSELLCQGENEIFVKSALGPVVQSEVSCGHGGIIAELAVCLKEKEKLIRTDSSWECRRDEAYQSSTEWNGCKSYENTEEVEVGKKWKQAQCVDGQEQFPELLPSEIPNLRYIRKKVETILNPFDEGGRIHFEKENGKIKIKKGAPITFWMDFGRIYAAFPHMTIVGAENIKITLHMQEFPGKVEREGTTETYILRQGKNSIQSLRMHSIHMIQVTVSNVYDDIEIQDAEIDISVYPGDMKGWFHCSEPILDQIYLLGCRTNQICRQTYHMDSPVHQEPLGCMGDYMIESLMNYYSFGDPYLTRFDILKISYYLRLKKFRMFHPSYCLLYIHMIYDYIMYTGDKKIAEKLDDVICGVIERFLGYLGDNMLIEYSPSYMFMDWVAEGDMNRHHPPKCMGQGYMTVLLAGAIKTAHKIFQWGGTAGRCKEYMKLHDAIAGSVNHLLWNEEKGLYRDGLYDARATEASRWMPADVKREFYSQHMNTLAVLYDIAPKERQRVLMKKVMEDTSLSQAQPYFMHFIFIALKKTGLFKQYGLDQLKRWELLLQENPTGLKEVWSGFDCDYSHAWGGTPTYQMPAQILGVLPMTPGFESVKIEPCLPDGLQWAEGEVPTPKGTIYVKVEKKDGGLKKEVKLPKGVQEYKVSGERK